MRAICLGLGLAIAAGSASAQAITFETDASFEDAAFSLENAITNKGLVIDHVSHTGDMLARTGEDVGSDVKLFEAADVYQFCSALISREVMEADPMNLAFCPYGIFVAERDGVVMYGFQDYPDGPMDKVEALLTEIVQSAMSF